MTRVLVLGGGPDAEREISLTSSRAVFDACIDAGLDAEMLVIDRPTLADVRSWDTDVIFPVLHGRFGEGGELQRLMESAGTPFVGSGSSGAKIAMDKMGTKLCAACLGIATPTGAILDPGDTIRPDHAVCPLKFPIVIKPVAEGSSVGLHLCDTSEDWVSALGAIRGDPRVYMIEQRIVGREITVGVLQEDSGAFRALPIIEIVPRSGTYDFNAKYTSNDTVYRENPELPGSMGESVQRDAARLCENLGLHHLARVDFLVPTAGSEPMLLEVNTMPGFTSSSLYPMASRAAGIGFPDLCAELVRLAARNAVNL